MSKERQLLLMLLKRYRLEKHLRMRYNDTRSNEVLWDRWNVVQLARNIVYGKD